MFPRKKKREREREREGGRQTSLHTPKAQRLESFPLWRVTPEPFERASVLKYTPPLGVPQIEKKEFASGS